MKCLNLTVPLHLAKSSRTPSWRPPFEWVADLVLQAREAGCKVYFKSNLISVERKNLKDDFPDQAYIGGSRILELPFDAPIKADPVEVPARMDKFPAAPRNYLPQ
jgi:hypothetical protein